MSSAHVTHPSNILRLSGQVRWWDADARCHLVVSQPELDPGLWAVYGAGAVASYRRHGVECALDRGALESGADTIMFFVALDEHDTMVAGVRAKGPLRHAQDSHAVVEWNNQPGQAAVAKMITDRLPYGVLEMKSAWVNEEAPQRRELTDAIVRSGFHMSALLDAQFCMATGAAFVLNRWRTSGAMVAPIPATPYPDARYQTKMIWWDRRTFTRHAQPHQAAKILTEAHNIKTHLTPTTTGHTGLVTHG
jgi:hypothetical protein